MNEALCTMITDGSINASVLVDDIIENSDKIYNIYIQFNNDSETASAEIKSIATYFDELNHKFALLYDIINTMGIQVNDELKYLTCFLNSNVTTPVRERIQLNAEDQMLAETFTAPLTKIEVCPAMDNGPLRLKFTKVESNTSIMAALTDTVKDYMDSMYTVNEYCNNRIHDMRQSIMNYLDVLRNGRGEIPIIELSQKFFENDVRFDYAMYKTIIADMVKACTLSDLNVKAFYDTWYRVIQSKLEL